MSLTKEKKQDIIQTFAINENDTGSAQVQIAILTEKISYLTQHMNTHKKDFHSRRGLLMMSSRRKKLLSYLKKTDVEQYEAILKKLGLRGVK